MVNGVLETCRFVADQATHVRVDLEALDAEVKAHPDRYSVEALPPSWQNSYHFFDAMNADLTAQYILVLDSMNFCFHPVLGYEYEHLASSLARVLHKNPDGFRADRLARVTAEELSAWLFGGGGGKQDASHRSGSGSSISSIVTYEASKSSSISNCVFITFDQDALFFLYI